MKRRLILILITIIQILNKVNKEHVAYFVYIPETIL